MGNSCQSRGGARITNFLLHTQEGDGTAESLASYLNNPNNEASYHYTVRNGVVCDVVNTDLASWSVGDFNSNSINLCFAGSRASWSRAQWLTIRDDIRIAAWLAVQDARKYGFSTEVIAPPYGRRRDGISDHEYVTDVIGWGSHTDVGPGFPWDVFTSDVNAFANNQGDEVALEETFTNYKGQQVTLGTAIRYMDQYVNEIREQLGGPQPFKGWSQLGGKTMVDSLADAHRKIDAIAAAIDALAKSKSA
jgi:N-acetyl-anhydromuramyl-L-alanine amidase AmpD